MNIPDNLRYTKEHEWVSLKGNIATIGVTEHAQEQLGDIVFVELPGVGGELKAAETFGVLESVKAVSDCYAPVSGRVTEVNDHLNEAPETINEDCYGEGWMIRVELSQPNELESLMDDKTYQAYIEQESA